MQHIPCEALERERDAQTPTFKVFIVQWGDRHLREEVYYIVRGAMLAICGGYSRILGEWSALELGVEGWEKDCEEQALSSDTTKLES